MNERYNASWVSSIRSAKEATTAGELHDEVHAPEREPVRAASLLGYALATLLYFLAAAYLVSRSLDVLNSDAVAYLRIAQYYAQGRFDLAVNSCWGPMLSWLLVPAVLLKIDLPLAARVIQVLSGFGFAVSVSILTRRFTGGRGALLGLVSGLLLSLPLFPSIITPDLTLAFLITLYFALMAPLLNGSSLSFAFGAGVVAGAAFLTKHYALPFVAAHMALTVAIRWFLVRRKLMQGPVARPILVAAGALSAIALPWIAIMSLHDGSLTVSSAGRFAADYTFVARHGIMYPNHQLQQPREGRIVASENRLEGMYARPDHHPLMSAAALKDRIGHLKYYGSLAVKFAKSVDLLGLVFCAAVIALFRATRSNAFLWSRQGIYAVWALCSVGLYTAGYVSMNVEERLLWPEWGILLALAVSMFVFPSGAPWEPLDRGKAAGMATWFWGLLVLISLGFNATDRVRHDSSYLAWSTDCRKATKELPLKGHFAVNGNWNTLVDAYALAYRTNTPFLGLIQGRSAESIAEELEPFGDVQLLILSDPDLVGRLKQHPQFEMLKTLEGEPWRYSYNLFRFHPSERATTKG